ncbi:hypothetical protein [Bacillus velezensis]|uniref:hypothetical protein n=1 Tax=Bacillus velezensis TaxID=492670 RepID=UPI0009F3F66D|nr:hypothetical protein [Bacillus velezensis]OQV53341.1 hypothetical protein B5Z20_03235 [Bacillus velezensis]OQV55364.1 hypothetical protein B5Z22_08100 [Bacillus velezensis]OQV60855.1 hypothetical protein B5Z24_08105 [Bacillus velezensis]OQV61922.1 hypothetical protein B5Z23_08090 [Bacillus velezensis]
MAETKKYVRILKAKYESSWYVNKIGELFELTEDTGAFYDVSVPGSVRLVNVEDAELIITEKRPAKVGERVLITAAAPIWEQSYETGDVFVAESLYDPFTKDIRVLGMPDFIDYHEYEVIVNNANKNEEADGMESVNQTAIDSASTVFEKVGEDYIGSKSRFGDILIGAPYSEAFVKTYANERKDVLVIPKTIEYTAFLRSEEMKKVATSGKAPIVSAQARRDEIVEQAKADVEELSNYGDGVRCETGPVSFATCNVEFVANRDKRTVVALLKGVRTGKVYAKGIAKAAPDDCFNVHIGKAIALRRALGLKVPDEYLNAPQPTEVRVGDVVYYSRMHPRLTVSEGIGKGEGFVSVQLVSEYLGDGVTRIIDDSREEVGE